MNRPLLTFLFELILLLIHRPSNLLIHAKRVSNTFKLSGAVSEHTATKFALSPHAEGKISIEFSVTKPYPPRGRPAVYYYSSEQTWERVKKAPTCDQKIKYASKSKQLVFSQKTVQNTGSKTRPDDVYFGANIQSDVSDGVIPSINRPQYWYITVADCALELSFMDRSVPDVHYSLEIMDETSPGLYSQLSHDEQGLSSLHFLNSILSLSISAWLLFQIHKRVRKNQELHISIFLIISASAMHAFSSFCQIVHLRIYANNGIGSYTADFLSAHAEAFVDSLFCWILLAVGVGWTLPVDLSMRTSDESNKVILDILSLLRTGFSTQTIKNPALLIFSLFVIIHAILCQWGRTYDDDFDCYHDLEHPPGRVLLFFRLFLAILFLLSTAALKKHCHSQSLSKFFHQFSLIGASWFVSLPSLAILISSDTLKIPVHRRHPIMTMLSMALQVVSLMSLGWLFSGAEDSSAYHKVSTVNDGLGSSGLGVSVGTGSIRSIFKIGKTKIRLD